MVNKWKNRLLSMFLVLTLCLSMTSTSTLAVEAAGQSTAVGHEKVTTPDNGQNGTGNVNAGNGKAENNSVNTGNGENENNDVSTGNGEDENDDISAGNGENKDNDISGGNAKVRSNDVSNGDGEDDITYAAENTTTGKKYQYLSEALNEAQDGETVTLLADNQFIYRNVCVTSGKTGENKTVTLNLNGKTCSGTGSTSVIHIGVGRKPDEGTGTLKIVGYGNILQSGIYASIYVNDGSTLDLSGWKGGEITRVSVGGNSSTYKNGAITGNIPENGKIGTLLFSHTWGELNIALNGGSYGIIQAIGDQDIYAKTILAKSYAFRNADGTFVPYEEKIGWSNINDVTVVKCNHEYTNEDEVFTDGTCNACGYVCPHEDANVVNGTCTVCGTIFAAQNINTGVRYQSLTDALNDAADGETLKVLADSTLTNSVDILNKTITLDLNGKTCDGDGFVISLGKYGTGDIATLKLIGTGNLKQPDKYNAASFSIYDGSTLDFTGWQGGEIASLSVYPKAKIQTKDMSGTIGEVSLNGIPDGGGITLDGGSYGKIYLLDFSEGSMKAGSLLAVGYAFKNQDGTMVPYNRTLTHGIDVGLTNVTVVKCTAHQDKDGDEYCDGCNADAASFVAAVTVGSGEVYYFTAETEGGSASAIPSAVVYANENGGTIKPLTDGIAIFNANCAINLNGKDVACITSGGSDLTVTGDGTVTSLDTKSYGAKLYGGSYKEISTSLNSITLGDLLPDGYGFQKTGTTWLTVEELAKSGTNILNNGTDAIGTVTVKQAPVTELTLTAQDITYTEDLTVTAEISTTDGAFAATYKWYLDGEEVSDKTEETLVISDEVYKNIGIYTIKCVVSCGTYVVSKEVTVTVNPADIKDANLAVIGEDNLFYSPASNDKNSGEALSVVYELRYKEKVLSTNDHIVTGNENIRSAGFYTLTVTGKGNYTGTKSITFLVKPCEMSDDVFTGNLIKSYDGTADIPQTLLNQLSFKPVANDTLRIGLERGVDYEVIGAQYDSTEVGDGKTVIMRVRMLNPNFSFPGGQRELEYVIRKTETNAEQSIIKATITPQPAELEVANNRAKTYEIDLGELLPELTAPQKYGQITYGLPVVQMKTDYYVVGNVKIENGVLSLPIEKVKTDEEGNIGNVHIVVSTTNYEDMVLEINVKATNKKETVSVSKQTPRVTELPVAAAQTYHPTKTLRDIALTGGKVLDANGNQIAGTWRWQNTQIVPLVGNKGYTAVFTPSDSAAYEQASSTIIVNVGKATPIIAIKPTAAAITYGKNLGASALSGGAAVYSEPDGILISGTFRWLHEDTVPTATADYTVIFTPTDTANYETVQTEVKVTVQNAPTTPDKPDKPDDTVDVLDESEENNEVPKDNKQDNGKNDGQNKDQNQENENNTGEPFVKDDSGKSGWELIKDEMKDTKDGGTIVVDMNGATNVPSDIFEYLKGKDMKVQFDMGDGIVWTVSGKDVTDIKGDINLGVTFGSEAGKTIPVDVINTITQENYSMNLTLAYNGEFGFTATLTVNLKEENAGYYANLFYYNADSGELEFVCADRIDEEGNVNLTFTHASDYTIVLTDSVMNGTESPKASDNGVVWTKMWILLLGCAVVVVGLGIFFIIGRKKSNMRAE